MAHQPDELLSAIKARRVPSWGWLPLIEIVENALTARAGRAKAGRESAQRRSKRIENAIRRVAGALPVHHPLHTLTSVIRARLERRSDDQLAELGLASIPSDTTIRATVRKMRKEQEQQDATVTPHPPCDEQ